MIKHIVMWKLKDENKRENALKIKNDLEALKGKIKEIKSIEVGVNINNSNDAYDAILYSEFDNEADLKAYQVNEHHQKVREFVKAVRVDRKVVDYEV